MMKVKDILKELQNIDPEANVSFSFPDGCCSDMEYLSGAEIDVHKPIAGGKQYVDFTFDSPPNRGYESCIKSGKVSDFAVSLTAKPKFRKTVDKLLKGEKK